MISIKSGHESLILSPEIWVCADSTIKKLGVCTKRVPQCPWQNWGKLLPTVSAIWTNSWQGRDRQSRCSEEKQGVGSQCVRPPAAVVWLCLCLCSPWKTHSSLLAWVWTSQRWLAGTHWGTWGTAIVQLPVSKVTPFWLEQKHSGRICSC